MCNCSNCVLTLHLLVFVYCPINIVHYTVLFRGYCSWVHCYVRSRHVALGIIIRRRVIITICGFSFSLFVVRVRGSLFSGQWCFVFNYYYSVVVIMVRMLLGIVACVRGIVVIIIFIISC